LGIGLFQRLNDLEHTRVFDLDNGTPIQTVGRAWVNASVKQSYAMQFFAEARAIDVLSYCLMRIFNPCLNHMLFWYPFCMHISDQWSHTSPRFAAPKWQSAGSRQPG
jgi:hypothetical protein